MQKTIKKESKPAARPSTSPKVSTAKAAPLAHGVGRRKSSIARVWIRRGRGAITVNGQSVMDYFETPITRQAAGLPFLVVPVSASYDADVAVVGGGMSSQADAVKLAIARAFVTHDESMRALLREHNLLTVDARRKERKKYGRKAARRGFQFVKR